jgi:hypothetical protein
MPSYVVIETDAGLMLAEVERGESAEVAAEKHGGVVVDDTLYSTYDDAYDAMLSLEAEEDEPRG